MRKHSLYSLIGKAVIGNVSTVSQDELEETKLWHLRLGLLSEKRLIELSK